MAGVAFVGGGPLLCYGCSGGGPWRIRRPLRVCCSPESQRASPRAAVRDGGGGSRLGGSLSSAAAGGRAFGQNLLELAGAVFACVGGLGGFAGRWVESSCLSPA